MNLHPLNLLLLLLLTTLSFTITTTNAAPAPPIHLSSIRPITTTAKGPPIKFYAAIDSSSDRALKGTNKIEWQIQCHTDKRGFAWPDDKLSKLNEALKSGFPGYVEGSYHRYALEVPGYTLVEFRTEMEEGDGEKRREPTAKEVEGWFEEALKKVDAIKGVYET